MSWTQALVLGAIQGATEFLPVSSSAHLYLTSWLLGWPDQGQAFDAALHLGTLAAIALYYQRDLRDLAAGLPRRDPQAWTLAGMLVLATLPAAAAGILLDDWLEAWGRRPAAVAAALILFGALLAVADRATKGKPGSPTLTWGHAGLIGCVQALALWPGVSRSGITLTAALLLGLERKIAARFIFLLALPVTAGAGLLKLKDVAPAALSGPVWLGVAAAAVSGFAAIGLLVRLMDSGVLTVLACYRILLGAAILYSAR